MEGPMTTQRLTADEKYTLLMQAAQTAMPGKLTRTAMELLGTHSEGTVGCIVRRLKRAGYDMADWEAAGRAGQAMGSRMHRPRPVAEVPEYVIARREEWLADMRVTTRTPGAVERLADKWGCDRATVYNRIAALRALGHDLSWWRPSARSATPPQPEPVVEVPRVFVPLDSTNHRPAVPWTMQAVADIADVPLIKARFVARGLGIPFDTVLLNRPEALDLLSALGFVPNIAA